MSSRMSLCAAMAPLDLMFHRLLSQLGLILLVACPVTVPVEGVLHSRSPTPVPIDGRGIARGGLRGRARSACTESSCFLSASPLAWSCWSAARAESCIATAWSTLRVVARDHALIVGESRSRVSVTVALDDRDRGQQQEGRQGRDWSGNHVSSLLQCVSNGSRTRELRRRTVAISRPCTPGHEEGGLGGN